MKIIIRLVDDAELDLIKPLETSPEKSIQWKAPDNNPLRIPRPVSNDGVPQGHYNLFMFTYAPVCTLDTR